MRCVDLMCSLDMEWAVAGRHIIFNLVTQQLGGRLAFESRLGWGTRFRITLPRVAPGESPAAQAAQ